MELFHQRWCATDSWVLFCSFCVLKRLYGQTMAKNIKYWYVNGLQKKPFKLDLSCFRVRCLTRPICRSISVWFPTKMPVAGVNTKALVTWSRSPVLKLHPLPAYTLKIINSRRSTVRPFLQLLLMTITWSNCRVLVIWSVLKRGLPCRENQPVGDSAVPSESPWLALLNL